MLNLAPLTAIIGSRKEGADSLEHPTLLIMLYILLVMLLLLELIVMLLLLELDLELMLLLLRIVLLLENRIVKLEIINLLFLAE